MNKLLLVLVAAFMLFSCSKENEASPKAASITGKWNITADTSQTFGYAPYIIVGINSPYMQFNADGSGTSKNNISTPDAAFSFTYTLSKDTISLNYPIQPQRPYVYAVKGVIKKLTSTNLVLEYNINDPTIKVKERVYMSK